MGSYGRIASCASEELLPSDVRPLPDGNVRRSPLLIKLVRAFLTRADGDITRTVDEIGISRNYHDIMNQ